MYLLDTNIISELRKLKPHGAVLSWFQTVSTPQIFLSAVTIGELQAGIEMTKKQDSIKALEIETWLGSLPASFQVLPMDMECFREYARLMNGRSHDLIEDAMIAATARVHRMTVVTRNTKDFRYFPVETYNPFHYKP
ncbi:type II toxin-antitoxin system VapC family toxin [Acidobacterium sp. S8]|uniref:type II toxin-antitoxin system VapC family toxin n=1 Tax=Acidobacterium sp. S8 TaxID=1641854 RepID=UPI00131C9E1A|nr:type II toxin-antitoxin system VapC family toxin [Acidobacterium sp. S8]